VPTEIEPQAPTSLEFANLKPRGNVTPSPADWGDQTLYFLLPDRFSDTREPQRPMYDRNNPTAFKAESHEWMKSGAVFQGGTLNGVISKLGYLQSLGVTTLWIGPIWKQRSEDNTSYHGYAIQNFLDVDPRFGTRQDLRDLVDAAHERGMYVLLDVIYNHTGNNFFYADESGQSKEQMPYRKSPAYPFHGWRSRSGHSIARCEDLEDGVWPIEFQNPDWYTRAGTIVNWDDPGKELASDAEFRRGDFLTLKDINLGNSEALDACVRCYQYWIALSDCDGFRIDTVKHVPPEISAIFCHEIRTFARRLGKKNFLMLGEVTGDPTIARHYVDPDGPNLDCVLDIESAPKRLADFVKGLAAPDEFLSHFGGRDALGDVRLIGRHHVSILDDHDMVCRPHKHRFNWNNQSADPFAQTAHAIGVQLTTPGIPCIYYGTEQAFSGAEFLHDEQLEPRCGNGLIACADRYVRESMFGSTFGAFQTSGCHFFDPSHPTYRRIRTIARLRLRDDAIGTALRTGSLHVRETRILGSDFNGPRQGEIVAYSRIHEQTAVIVALNTHGTDARGADVTIDATLHPPGSKLRVLYRSDWNDDLLECAESQELTEVQHLPDGRAIIRVDLPPAGMAIYA
jgi:glycosidase